MRVVQDFTDSFRRSSNDEASGTSAHTEMRLGSESVVRQSSLDAVMRGENDSISAPGLSWLRHLSDMQNPVLEEDARASIARHVRNDVSILRSDAEFRRCLPLVLTRCRKLPHQVRREAWRIATDG